MKWVSKSQDNIFSIYILHIKHRDVDTISDKYNIKIHNHRRSFLEAKAIWGLTGIAGGLFLL